MLTVPKPLNVGEAMAVSQEKLSNTEGIATPKAVAYAASGRKQQVSVS